MNQPDAVLARVPHGIELRQQGRRAEARELFEQLWSEIGGDTGDPLRRCLIAHSIADAQDEVEDELQWDLTALTAAHEVSDEQSAAAGMGASVAAFFPSLHLNLAECYRKLGDLDQARAHLEHGRRSADALPAGEYADTVLAGLDELEQRVAG